MYWPKKFEHGASKLILSAGSFAFRDYLNDVCKLSARISVVPLSLWKRPVCSSLPSGRNRPSCGLAGPHQGGGASRAQNQTQPAHSGSFSLCLALAACAARRLLVPSQVLSMHPGSWTVGRDHRTSGKSQISVSFKGNARPGNYHAFPFCS